MRNLETKKAIRKQILERRNALDGKQRQRLSARIAETLYTTEEYQKTETLLTYVSYGSEVDTFSMIRRSLTEGKKVYCPRVLAPGQMEFYRIHSLEELQLGYQGIPEPVGAEAFPKATACSKGSILMLMPLTVFDRERNRIGYGGGFYDRYLSATEGINTIGLAFECQRWKEILLIEPHDIRPSRIITESEIY